MPSQREGFGAVGSVEKGVSSGIVERESQHHQEWCRDFDLKKCFSLFHLWQWTLIQVVEPLLPSPRVDPHHPVNGKTESGSDVWDV